MYTVLTHENMQLRNILFLGGSNFKATNLFNDFSTVDGAIWCCVHAFTDKLPWIKIIMRYTNNVHNDSRHHALHMQPCSILWKKIQVAPIDSYDAMYIHTTCTDISMPLIQVISSFPPLHDTITLCTEHTMRHFISFRIKSYSYFTIACNVSISNN